MISRNTTTRMPILSCRLLLLLMMLLQPFLAVAGRPIPAAAPMVSTASSTPTPQIELSTAAAAAALTADDQETEFAVVTWKRGRHYQDFPPLDISIFRVNVEGATMNREVKTIYGHRLLLGSAPPSCSGKCGSCVPCSPIHISLGGPHGSLTQQEYYPEAWRCKCGNRFFMP